MAPPVDPTGKESPNECHQVQPQGCVVVLVQPSVEVQLIRVLQKVVQANPKLFPNHTITFVGVGLLLRVAKAGVVLEAVEEPEKGLAMWAICLRRDLARQAQGSKSEVATSPLPSRGPKRGQKCYVTPASRGSSAKGNKIRSGYITPAFSGAQNWADWLHNPCLLGGPQQWGLIQKWLHNPCHLTSAQNGGTSKLIHGRFHIGDDPQRHHLWGEEAQKGKNGNKN